MKKVICTMASLGGKFKRVARRAQLLANFQITDAQWEYLMIPINMAFFFRSSLEDRIVTVYPSPAGAVESLLPLDAWDEIVEENPILAQLRPDIEALLANRVGHAQELLRRRGGLDGDRALLLGAKIEGRPGKRGSPYLT
jgi:hypothetical protein